MLFIKKDGDLNDISREEFVGMTFAKEMIRSWQQSQIAMHWLMNEYFIHCYKHEIDTILSKEKVKNNLIEFFNK